MKIHGTAADRTTTGQGNLGALVFGKQRPQDKNGGAHRLYQFVRRAQIGDRAAVDFDIELLIDNGLHAHTP